MTKEKMQKITLVIILGLGLIYAYVSYLFLPKWTLIQNQRDQLEKKTASYQKLNTYQSNQEEIAKTIADLETEVKDLAAKIPAQLDKPQIMVDIYTMAKLHAVEPQTLKFEPIKTVGDHQELSMNLSYIGPAENIINLIDDLQHTSLHKFALHSVNLSVSKPDNKKNEKTTNILLNPDKVTTSDILGAIKNIDPVIIMDKTQLSADIKFVAYSSPIGNGDGTNKKPAFMFSKFGAESIARMFDPFVE